MGRRRGKAVPKDQKDLQTMENAAVGSETPAGASKYTGEEEEEEEEVGAADTGAEHSKMSEDTARIGRSGTKQTKSTAAGSGTTSSRQAMMTWKTTSSPSSGSAEDVERRADREGQLLSSPSSEDVGAFPLSYSSASPAGEDENVRSSGSTRRSPASCEVAPAGATGPCQDDLPIADAVLGGEPAQTDSVSRVPGAASVAEVGGEEVREEVRAEERDDFVGEREENLRKRVAEDQVMPTTAALSKQGENYFPAPLKPATSSAGGKPTAQASPKNLTEIDSISAIGAMDQPNNSSSLGVSWALRSRSIANGGVQTAGMSSLDDESGELSSGGEGLHSNRRRVPLGTSSSRGKENYPAEKNPLRGPGSGVSGGVASSRNMNALPKRDFLPKGTTRSSLHRREEEISHEDDQMNQSIHFARIEGPTEKFNNFEGPRLHERHVDSASPQSGDMNFHSRSKEKPVWELNGTAMTEDAGSFELALDGASARKKRGDVFGEKPSRPEKSPQDEVSSKKFPPAEKLGDHDHHLLNTSFADLTAISGASWMMGSEDGRTKYYDHGDDVRNHRLFAHHRRRRVPSSRGGDINMPRRNNFREPVEKKAVVVHEGEELEYVARYLAEIPGKVARTIMDLWRSASSKFFMFRKNRQSTPHHVSKLITNLPKIENDPSPPKTSRGRQPRFYTTSTCGLAPRPRREYPTGPSGFSTGTGYPLVREPWGRGIPQTGGARWLRFTRPWLQQANRRGCQTRAVAKC